MVDGFGVPVEGEGIPVVWNVQKRLDQDISSAMRRAFPGVINTADGISVLIAEREGSANLRTFRADVHVQRILPVRFALEVEVQPSVAGQLLVSVRPAGRVPRLALTLKMYLEAVSALIDAIDEHLAIEIPAALRAA